MFEIYLVENTVNDKVYVGVTSIGIRERWYAHRSCANQGVQYPLYIDMKQFGLDKFSIRILDSTDSEEERDRLEVYYIKQYNSFYPNGYNLTEGGVHTKNPIWLVDEELNKLRSSKISAANKGVPKSEIHKQHISEARMGKYTKEANAFYGKHHSDATKKLLSDMRSTRPVDMIDSETHEVLMQFRNLVDAGKYVVSAGLSKGQPSTCASRIHEVAKSTNQNCTAYGFHWRFTKVQRLSCTLEDELQAEAQSIVEQHDNDIV